MTDLSFGKWLKLRRRGLGLTQNELAQRVGYSGETLRKVEANALRPSRQMAEQLAQQLDIAPNDRAAFIRFARDESQGHPESLPFPGSLQRSSLPIQPFDLIGRETEPGVLSQLLLDDGARLVTLLGPPGIGKTRLALHIAGLLEGAFADGAAFVALAPLTEPGLVAGELAQALGVREAGSQSVTDRLKSHLRGRQMLLVLDNFEHMLGAAGLVAELLATCPGVKVLATSRAPLHLAGEHEFEVPALALPNLAPLPPLASLAGYPAVRLYVQRTQAIKPSFRLTEANARAVAEVCVRLDGLPLAIELAAARSKLFSPAALLARLDERLALLTSDARDRPARHQTLRNTIDWSYNLLDPAGQTLFARLAVFAGGCTLEAAEAVCGEEAHPQEAADSPQRVLRAERLQLDRLLGALIDQSLVRHADGQDGEPRFWMLETLREYALERLEASGHAERLRRQHAHYFLALAESAKMNARGTEQGLWLDRLAADHDNFRAVLAWSLKADDGAELGLRLANGLGKFWRVRSYYTEGQKWFTEVLRRTQDTPSLQRVEALSMVSLLAWVRYDYPQQEEFAQEAVAIARQLGGPRCLCPTLNRLVHALYTRGDFTAAHAAGLESLDWARTSGDARLEADALQTLGMMSKNQGAFAAAIVYGEQALALARKCDDPLFEARLHGDLGEASWFLGQYDLAVNHLNWGYQLFQDAGDKRSLGVMQWALGFVALDQCRLTIATSHFRRCLSFFRQSDYPNGQCGYLLGMAGIATARGHAAAAVRLSGAAGALRTALGHRLEGHLPAYFERQLARARAQLHDDTFAAAWAAGQALTPEQAIIEALAEEVTEPEQA